MKKIGGEGVLVSGIFFSTAGRCKGWLAHSVIISSCFSIRSSASVFWCWIVSMRR